MHTLYIWSRFWAENFLLWSEKLQNRQRNCGMSACLSICFLKSFIFFISIEHFRQKRRVGSIMVGGKRQRAWRRSLSDIGQPFWINNNLLLIGLKTEAYKHWSAEMGMWREGEISKTSSGCFCMRRRVTGHKFGSFRVAWAGNAKSAI